LSAIRGGNKSNKSKIIKIGPAVLDSGTLTTPVSSISSQVDQTVHSVQNFINIGSIRQKTRCQKFGLNVIGMSIVNLSTTKTIDWTLISTQKTTDVMLDTGAN
ncbi:hypothetical protein L9F63_024368, partial [Diploptera punctata]